KAVLKYVSESNSRVLGLQNGDFDAITNVPFNQAAQVKELAGIKLEVSPSYRLDYVYLNAAKKPLDDKRIRLALNYAANREAILKLVYFGYGEIPNSYMPKVNFWSDKVAAIEGDYTGATEAFFTRYKNDEVVGLLKQGRQTMDPAKRAEAYARIQDILYHDGYSVPLNFAPYVNASHDYLQNWHNITVGWWWLKNMWLDK